MSEENKTEEIRIPAKLAEDWASFLSNWKLLGWAKLFLRFIVVAVFVYIAGAGGGYQSVSYGNGGSYYYLVDDPLNSVRIPNEPFVRAVNVPDFPVVDGTFVVIYVGGVLSESEPSFFDILGQLETASKQSNLRAVILHVRSPGGTVSASEKLREEVLRLKQAGVKIISLYDGVAASGACLMSIDSDYIIATRSSIVGSIGVIFEWYNISGLMNNLGIKLEVYKSGKFKDMGSFARNPSAEEVELFNGLVKETFDRFVDLIVNGRSLTREEVMTFANGAVFSPTVALKHKLIDQISDSGKRDAVIKAMELTGVNRPRVYRLLRVNDFFSSVPYSLGQTKSGNNENKSSEMNEFPVLKYQWQPLTSQSLPR